jgi:hypothetical protein
VVVGFIGGGNRSTWRKQQICRKSLTNFIIDQIVLKNLIKSSLIIKECPEEILRNWQLS